MAAIFGSICILLKLYFVATAAEIDENDIPVLSAQEACGPNQPMVVTDKFGYLTSPKFDDFHLVEANLSCSWLLKAPQDTIIDFKYIVRNKPVGGNCAKEDFLEIYDGSIPGAIPLEDSCASKNRNDAFQSTQDTVYIQYKTGPMPRHTGFRLYFEHTQPQVSCYGQEMHCRHGKSCYVPRMECDGVAHCSDGTDEENCPVEDSIPKDCGKQDIPPILGNDRIVGGRQAIPWSWPWMVDLRLKRSEPRGHRCGGTLITEKWVLTAGHCFRGYQDSELWTAVVGKHHSVRRDEVEQTRYIEKIFIYPDYKGLEPLRPNVSWLSTKQHDIALVKLNAPVKINTYVKPVCLPHYEGELASKTICHVTGWGITHGTGYDYVLKQAAVPVVSRKDCDRLFKSKDIGETMLCAGYSYGGHDACVADSGGPLVLQDSTNRWDIVGVVSTGEGCAMANAPGIYTEVVHYLQWINHTITGSRVSSASSRRVLA